MATALIITGIGMTLLFLSLILFYGITSLLAAATRDRPAAPSGRTDSAGEREAALEDRALQAAAIAIALARAEAEEVTGRTGESTTLASGDRDVSPWWALHHQNRLTGMGKPRRL